MSDKKLMVKCQHCNDWFPSRLVQMDEKSFESVQMVGNSEPCQHCGKQTEVSNNTVQFF